MYHRRWRRGAQVASRDQICGMRGPGRAAPARGATADRGVHMKVHLQYGRDGIDVEIPSARVRVIEPAFVEGLADEAAAFTAAVRSPIGGKPLR